MALDVFQFQDYREFLNAHFEEQRVRTKAWSTRYWCRKLGFQSSSTLNMILRGRRNPGTDATQKFKQYFDFSPIQAEYFHNLVRLAKAKNPNTVSAIREKLQITAIDREIESSEFYQQSVIGDPLCWIIREMTIRKDFKESPRWIQKQLTTATKIRDIQSAVKRLVKAGLLIRKDGRLVPTEINISTTNDVANAAIKSYHKRSLETSLDWIDNIDEASREISSSIFNCRAEDFDSLKKDLRDFRRSLHAKYQCFDADQTICLNFQLLPMTQEKGRLND